jgi:hypothetical protein
MARLARVVIPGHPHHVTQRGNGRARTFFGDEDYALYRDMLAENCRAPRRASGDRSATITCWPVETAVPIRKDMTRGGDL